VVHDPVRGAVHLSGALSDRPRAPAILVIVHGLGGSANSGYAVRMARVAVARGLAVLRLNLRGADRGGEDVYHAGLTADLQAALTSPAVKAHGCRLLVGFSLGGHVSLRAVREDPALAAGVAAICAPLDLEAAARYADHPRRAVYRHYVLSQLREMYRATAARRPGLLAPISSRALRAIRTLRAWDDAVIAPRFGFAGADDYYRQMSVGPQLSEITVPTLFTATTADPMVSAATLRPYLARASSAVEVRWVERGGHVHFPPWEHFEAQVLDWFQLHSIGG
jgi:predicted alpha/beta-fold hydrolase